MSSITIRSCATPDIDSKWRDGEHVIVISSNGDDLRITHQDPAVDHREAIERLLGAIGLPDHPAIRFGDLDAAAAAARSHFDLRCSTAANTATDAAIQSLLEAAGSWSFYERHTRPSLATARQDLAMKRERDQVSGAQMLLEALGVPVPRAAGTLALAVETARRQLSKQELEARNGGRVEAIRALMEILGVAVSNSCTIEQACAMLRAKIALVVAELQPGTPGRG